MNKDIQKLAEKYGIDKNFLHDLFDIIRKDTAIDEARKGTIERLQETLKTGERLHKTGVGAYEFMRMRVESEVKFLQGLIKNN